MNFGKLVANAKENEGGVYPEPGVYTIRVEKVIQRQRRNKSDCFIVECGVVESNNPSRPVGSTMSWIVGFDKDAAPSNVKAFLCAAVRAGGGNPDELSDSDFESLYNEAISDAQPLANLTLGLVATNVKTKAQKDFTKVTFKAV